jgi:hypothetical protein
LPPDLACDRRYVIFLADIADKGVSLTAARHDFPPSKSPLRATRATVAPASANASAICLPRPLLAPVTTAIRPSSR